MLRRSRLAPVVLALLPACGGSSPGPSQPSPTAPQSVTFTFSGSTRQTGQGSCGGDSHDFTAADGEVSVTLVETSDPAGALSMQVCAGGVDNRDCTINQQKIAVGQTLKGSRKGSTTQNLKLLPHNCVFGGPFEPTPVTYRVTVTHLR